MFSSLHVVVLSSQEVKLNMIFNWNFFHFFFRLGGNSLVENWTFLEEHIMAVWWCPQTATNQTCSRNIQTKDTLVPSWILEHRFLHFPSNDSISTSLASHSTQLSFFKDVPSSYMDWLFWSCQILPWILLMHWYCIRGYTAKSNCTVEEERCP